MNEQQWYYAFGAPPPNIPVVPMPSGYRRAAPKEITKPVLTFANKALQHALPIGKQQTTTVAEKDGAHHLVMALTEVHWDNHPPRPKQGFKAYEGPEFLHPGISMLVPNFHADDTQVAMTSTPDKWPHRQINPYPTEAPGTIHSQNIYAGDAEEWLKNHHDQLEIIFQKALGSLNAQAILTVAYAFQELGAQDKAQVLLQRVQAIT